MADPVGTPQQDIVEKYIAELQKRWDEQARPPVSWWKFWARPIISEHAVSFLLHCVDFLVLALDQTLLVAEDKKATVLAILAALFNYIVIPVLPIWAKPFSAQIETLVVTIIMSALIDLLCNKYHSAVWATATPPIPTGS